METCKRSVHKGYIPLQESLWLLDSAAVREKVKDVAKWSLLNTRISWRERPKNDWAIFHETDGKNQQRKLMRLLARETIAAMNTCNLNWCSELFIIHGVIAVLSEGSRCFRPERTMNNISSDTLNPLPWVFFLKWVYLNDCFAQQKYKYANLIFRGSQNQWQENKNRWQT